MSQAKAQFERAHILRHNQICSVRVTPLDLAGMVINLSMRIVNPTIYIIRAIVFQCLIENPCALSMGIRLFPKLSIVINLSVRGRSHFPSLSVHSLDRLIILSGTPPQTNLEAPQILREP